MSGPVLIVTGPAGAGKSTVARLVAGALPLAVHLETDQFFDAVRGGFIPPWLPESQHQNEVITRACARSAATYAAGGYTVVVDGVVLPWALAIYRGELTRTRHELALLLPPLDTVLARGPQRAREREPDLDAYAQIHASFAAMASEPGVTRFDPSVLSAEALAECLLARLTAS